MYYVWSLVDKLKGKPENILFPKVNLDWRGGVRGFFDHPVLPRGTEEGSRLRFVIWKLFFVFLHLFFLLSRFQLLLQH